VRFLQRFVEICLRGFSLQFTESDGMPDQSVLDERRVQAPAAQPVAEARAGSVALALYDRIDAVEAEWRRLEGEGDCTPFQAFDWLTAWSRHIAPHGRSTPAVVVGRLAGRALFILPLAVTAGAIRRLTFLGSDIADYNAPLLAREFSSSAEADDFADLWQACCRLLQGVPAYRHDLVGLTKMPATVGEQSNPFLALSVGPNPSNAYLAHLPGNWDAYYRERRSSATRRRDRTKLKRLTEYGEVRFVTPSQDVEIERTMTVLYEQKSKSLQRMGVADIFARPGWRDFFSDLAANPGTRDFVHVSRLDVGPLWSAINFGLTFRGSYYHVLASYDDGETSRFGPGVAHLRDLLRYAIEHGMTRFDFTIGDERYKREWSDETRLLYDHVAAASMRGLPAVALTGGIRRVRRAIKQNETLWNVVSRARAALGGRKADSGEPAPRIGKSPPIAPE
jgi:CelD/BcsL family acetyltransferase involved in cellulose biosynthesis